MLSLILVWLLALPTLIQAHFQLAFPPPRGAFNEDNEPTFCDGYTNPSANRTTFPLNGGVFTFNSEHPTWTAGVLVSNASNPTSFNNFSQIVPFFQLQGEGEFCIPLNVAASANGTNLKDGQNVTLQIVFDGGDGQLYQCADVTLSSAANVSGVTCSNATQGGNGSSNGNTSSSTPSAAGPAMSMGFGGLLTALCLTMLGIWGAL